MGTDIYLSIEEKRDGIWVKINNQKYYSIYREGWGANRLIDWLVYSATAMGWDNLPKDLSEETKEAMIYFDPYSDFQSIKNPELYMPRCGYIDVGDIRIIFWWEY